MCKKIALAWPWQGWRDGFSHAVHTLPVARAGG